MAFTEQNDSGNVANANAYIDDAFLDAYVTDRAYSYTGSPTVGDKQAAIVKATDYIDIRFRYGGNKSSMDQTTEFPRQSLRDRSGRLVSGIPLAVKEACAEYAFRALTADLLADPSRDGTGQAVKSERVKADVVESAVEYANGGSFQMPKYPMADQKLRRAGFVMGGNQVVRA